MSKFDVEKRIDQLLSEMTLREKIGQLNQSSYLTANIDYIKESVRNGDIGAFVLSSSCFAGNDDQDAVMVDELNEIQRIAVEESRMKIPVIFGRDTIHGYKTIYPIPLAQAASFNTALIRKSYHAIAEEATNDGINWAFTPMLDITRDPRWGRVIETPGEDPYLGMEIAKAAVNGLQGDDYTAKDSMAACAKHYIGYGGCEGGRDYNKVEISDYTLRNNYLKAFKAAVDSGVATVMSSFNEIGGLPVTANKYLLNDLLKEELGFDGFVVSDWATVIRLIRQGVAENETQCAEIAFNSGVDMDMAVECYRNNLEKLIGNEVSMDRLDDAVRRILRVKLRFGLFDNPITKSKQLDKSKFVSVAKELADESMVLLKNNNILPLNNNKKIALIGPMVDVRRPLLGSWSLDGIEENVVTLKEGIIDVFGKDNVITVEREMHDEMLRAAGMADVVVMALGESHMVTGEARCLADVSLPPEQKALLRRVKALGKPIVGVFVFGRPLALADVESEFDAILYAWHCGEQTGNSVADILSGKISPSGKTPISFPRVVGQIPMYYNVPSSGMWCSENGGKPVNAYYGKTNSYDDCPGTPLYPFGYGLSYSKFDYGEIYINENKISLDEINKGVKINLLVNVTNAGLVDAKEVVQCYVCDECASMSRPLRELKGFKKVLIKSGESVNISFEIGEQELGFYRNDGKFTVERGKFKVYIGDCCTSENFVEIEVV